MWAFDFLSGLSGSDWAGDAGDRSGFSGAWLAAPAESCGRWVVTRCWAVGYNVQVSATNVLAIRFVDAVYRVALYYVSSLPSRRSPNRPRDNPVQHFTEVVETDISENKRTAPLSGQLYRSGPSHGTGTPKSPATLIAETIHPSSKTMPSQHQPPAR